MREQSYSIFGGQNNKKNKKLKKKIITSSSHGKHGKMSPAQHITHQPMTPLELPRYSTTSQSRVHAMPP